MKTQVSYRQYFLVDDPNDPVLTYHLINTKHLKRECTLRIRQSTADFLNAASWMLHHNLKYVQHLPEGYAW